MPIYRYRVFNHLQVDEGSRNSKNKIYGRGSIPDMEDCMPVEGLKLSLNAGKPGKNVCLCQLAKSS
jgi:hypothetical protein